MVIGIQKYKRILPRNVREEIFPGFSIQGLGLFRISHRSCPYFILHHPEDCLDGKVRQKIFSFSCYFRHLGSIQMSFASGPQTAFLPHMLGNTADHPGGAANN